MFGDTLSILGKQIAIWIRSQGLFVGTYLRSPRLPARLLALPVHGGEPRGRRKPMETFGENYHVGRGCLFSF